MGKWKSQTQADADVDADVDVDTETSALTNMDRVITSVCVESAESLLRGSFSESVNYEES